MQKLDQKNEERVVRTHLQEYILVNTFAFPQADDKIYPDLPSTSTGQHGGKHLAWLSSQSPAITGQSFLFLPESVQKRQCKQHSWGFFWCGVVDCFLPVSWNSLL